MVRPSVPSQHLVDNDDDESQLAFDFSAPLKSLPQLWTPDDIFSRIDEAIIADFKEDGRVERKRVEVSRKDLSEYLSMWANTQPSGGLIFVGVGNDGKIMGCAHVEAKRLNDIESIRPLCPDARFDLKKVPVQNHKGKDDFIIVFRVHYRDDKVVETVSGDAFVREGEDKRLLTEIEKRELRLNKGELDVESERVPLTYPKDFDTGLIARFKEQYITKRRLSQMYTTEDILVINKLGKHSGGSFQPNLACALLFGKDARAVIPGAYIRVIRYDGVEEKFGGDLNSVASEVFDGPLPEQIAQADKFINSQIRSFTRLAADGRFATHPEYPRFVWLEALVNAVVHRSYNFKHMNIFVKMFENKLVIESPGGFMPPTTAETVYNAHNPRNPNLMWALFYFDYVQCAFEGTRRMRQTMRQANLPDPHFAQKKSGIFQVVVTLKNNQEFRKLYVRAEAAGSISSNLYDKLSESEKLVVNYLVEKERVDVTDAGLVVSKDWRATKKILDDMEEKKIIERSPGKPRSRHRFYFLPKGIRDGKSQK